MKRIMLAGFVVSVALIGVAQASAFFAATPPAWAPWLFMVGTSTSLVTIMGVGAARRGRLGPLRWVFAAVLLILLAGFGFALVLGPPASAGAALWMGLPPAAAVILYGIGLLPFLVVPVAYALTFDRDTLREEDWARVREMATRMHGERPVPGTDR